MKQNLLKKSFLQRLKQDFIRNKGLYIMILPIIIHYLVFAYYPMYGAQIAFRDYVKKVLEQKGIKIAEAK